MVSSTHYQTTCLSCRPFTFLSAIRKPTGNSHHSWRGLTRHLHNDVENRQENVDPTAAAKPGSAAAHPARASHIHPRDRASMQRRLPPVRSPSCATAQAARVCLHRLLVAWEHCLAHLPVTATHQPVQGEEPCRVEDKICGCWKFPRYFLFSFSSAYFPCYTFIVYFSKWTP